MTKEQEKMFVQQGDVVLVQGVVDKAHKSGDLLVRFEQMSGKYSFAWIGEVHVGKAFAVSAPPKYDPCRLFQKGDRVRLRKWSGREPVIYGMNLFQLGEVLTVVEAENPKEEGLILVSNAESKQSIHACYLELVTPVEEREPYVVRHNAAHAAWSIYGPYNLSAVNYFYGERYPYTEATAKAAAEAECDRLNAEYRKEVCNG